MMATAPTLPRNRQGVAAITKVARPSLTYPHASTPCRAVDTVGRVG
jgi:hypothetical protein